MKQKAQMAELLVVCVCVFGFHGSQEIIGLLSLQNDGIPLHFLHDKWLRGIKVHMHTNTNAKVLYTHTKRSSSVQRKLLHTLRCLKVILTEDRTEIFGIVH